MRAPNSGGGPGSILCDHKGVRRRLGAEGSVLLLWFSINEEI